MLTGSIKNKVDAIWQDFYNENMAQTSEIVNQLTTLMFIKMLDDRQSDMEANASKIVGIKLNESDLIFKSGEYSNYKYSPEYNQETGEFLLDENGDVVQKKELNFKIPYSDLRWKNFKNLNSLDLARRIRDYVVPFIKDPDNKNIGDFRKYAKKYSFGFDDKERLLASVVDKLSDDEFNFNNIDLMGDVYEYMCGSGISGQYRTPRHIIDMAVELMKPRLGEKIIDPAMGTAGFLIEAAKYIKKHQEKDLLNTNARKTFNEEMFYGCDNDSNMARIAYMNSILHGIKHPNFGTDSLLETNNGVPLFGKFDLVLANPPFSGSLVASATNGKILTTINSKSTGKPKTELLFVALMNLLLKPGGRCMSIVPDGVLFGSDNAHVSLRSELINRQKLKAVISMPAGIFNAPSKKGSSSKGSGVKTSFLIFEKTDKGGTDKVWFYNMEADGFSLDLKRAPVEENDIPDIIKRFENLDSEKARKRSEKSFLVPVEEIIKNNYDLTFNKYKETIKEEKHYRKSEDISADIVNGIKEQIATTNEIRKSLGLKEIEIKDLFSKEQIKAELESLKEFVGK